MIMQNYSRFRRFNILLLLLLCLSLITSAVPTNYANAAAQAVNKKVYITKGSYIQLTDANLVPSGNGATASFTFTFYNGDSNAINLVDYWARLKTNGGTKYTLSLLDADKKKKVLPNSSTTLTYYSEVGAKITLDQLVINIIKFDFSVAGYERSVAQFTFPKGYSNFVAAKGYKGILINNSSVNVRVDQINVTQKDKKLNFNLTFVARNNSKFGVALPQYNYYAQTSKGLYKLALRNKTDETLVLEPAVLNAIQLTGSIPSTVATTGWKLVITNNVGAETNKVELPVAIFDIPFKVTTTSTSSPKTTFTNNDGTYEIELKSVQRLPWNNEDNVIAEMVVKNNGSVYLPLPDLNGQLVIDENIKITGKAIKKTGDIGLAPGASTSISYIGSIPYSYTWKKFNLKLTEKNGETTNDIGNLTNSIVKPIQNVSVGKSFTQSNNGAPFEALITDVKTYSGEKTNVYAVFMDMTNKQNRSGSLSLLSGYFKTADGNLYEAKIVKSTNNIKAGNKEKLIIWADLPVNVDRTGMQLQIGEAFDDNGLILGSGTPKGYLRAAQFDLPEEKQAGSSFKDLKVGPYTIDMTYFNVWVNDTRLDVDIGADVSKDYSYDGYSQSQLSYEIIHEGTQKVLTSQLIDIEGKDEKNLNWKVGYNYQEVNKEMGDTLYWNEYTLRVYETFNGNKKILASMPITLSPMINWLDGKH